MIMSLEQRYQLGLAVIREAGELALGYFNARESLTILVQRCAGHGERG